MMVRSFLFCIFAASSSYAFASPPRPSFAARPVAVNMAGGEAPPPLKPPAALYEGAVAIGAAKAAAPFGKIFKLGIVSGAHIAIGGFLALSVGGACPGIAAANPGIQKMIFGAFGLPFGLMMTITTGGELFTGNTALVAAAVAREKPPRKTSSRTGVLRTLETLLDHSSLPTSVSRVELSEADLHRRQLPPPSAPCPLMSHLSGEFCAIGWYVWPCTWPLDAPPWLER